MLSANAGSGKTSVLVERFVASVVHDGLRADQMLAITFTEKAAGELRARVRGRLLELGEREAAREAEGAWITTFHGFCARVLRAHAVAAGLDPAFAVLDPADGRAAQREAFDAALADFLAAPRADALDLAAAYTVDRLQRMVLGAHDALRSRGQTRPALPTPRPADPGAARAALQRAYAAFAAELAGANGGAAVDAARQALEVCRVALGAGAAPIRRARRSARNAGALKTPAADAYRAACDDHVHALADQRAVPALALVDELLGRYADAYAAAKRARAGVDFDDLELLARDLLAREPGIAAGYRERFERIMVDEFQDTNPLQLELLELVARDNACTVGDELQVDLRLPPRRRRGLPRAPRAPGGGRADRHAGHQLPLAPGDPDARSTTPSAPLHERWVAAAPRPRRSAGRRAGGRAAADRRRRLERRCAHGARRGTARRQRGQQAEARLVAQRVGALVHEEGVAPRDIVVLLRASAEMGLYERALELAGLPTLAGGGAAGGDASRSATSATCSPRWPTRATRRRCSGCSPRRWSALSSDALALLALDAREGRTTIWEAVHEEALAPAPEDAAAPAGVPHVVRRRARARAAPRARRGPRARAAPHPLRPARARAAARRAAAGQRPQAAAPGGRLRGAPRARRARLHRPRHRRARGRRPRARRARRSRRPRRRAPDDDPRGQGARVPRRRRRRPRPPGQPQPARPDRQRGSRRPAAHRPRRRQGHRAGLRRHRGRAPRRRRGRGAARHARRDDARGGAPDPQRRRAPGRQLAPAGARRRADQLDRAGARPRCGHARSRRSGARPRPRAHRAQQPGQQRPAPRGARARRARRAARARAQRRGPGEHAGPGDGAGRARRGAATAARRAELLVAHPLRAVPLPLLPRARPRPRRAGAARAPARCRRAGAGARAARARHARPRAPRGAGPARPAPRCRTPRPSRAVAAVHDTELTDADVDDLRAMVGAFAGSTLRERLGAARAVHREQSLRLRAGRRAAAQRLRRRPRPRGRRRRADRRLQVRSRRRRRPRRARRGPLRHAAAHLRARRAALGRPRVEVAHLFLERPAEPAVVRYEQGDAEALESALRERRGAACWPASTRWPRSRIAGCAPPARAGRACAPTRRSSRTARSA